MKLKFLIYIVLFLFSFNSWAQKDSTKFTDNLFGSVTYGSGILAAHKSSMEYLVKDYYSYFNIEIGTSTYGKRPWETLFRYPSLGVGVYHGTNGNDEILGETTAFYGFISSPYHSEKKLSFGYKFSGGLSYLSKKFDIKDNIYNTAIGSNFNVFINFAFDLKIKLFNEKAFFKTGFGMTHFSNGKIQSPNLGLNFIDWHFTAAYYLGNQNKKLKKEFPKRDKHTFYLIMAGGAKEDNEPNLGKYFAGNLTLEYEYAVMKKSSWGLGLDYFFDGVIYDSYKKQNDKEAFAHAGRIGLHLGYVFNYNKVGFIVQLGRYLKPYYTINGYIYSRIGLRAKLSKHLIANLTMKTHWAKADIVEFGLGYYFTKK